MAKFGQGRDKMKVVEDTNLDNLEKADVAFAFNEMGLPLDVYYSEVTTRHSDDAPSVISDVKIVATGKYADKIRLALIDFEFHTFEEIN